jgi:hypothetical protein
MQYDAVVCCSKEKGRTGQKNVLHYTVQHCTVQLSTTLHYTLLYCTVTKRTYRWYGPLLFDEEEGNVVPPLVHPHRLLVAVRLHIVSGLSSVAITWQVERERERE